MAQTQPLAPENLARSKDAFPTNVVRGRFGIQRVNAPCKFVGVNQLGWHVFQAAALTAYQAKWITKWCVNATGGGWGASHKSPPATKNCWSWTSAADMYGYVWGNNAARLQPCTFSLSSDELAEAFSELWCSYEIDEAMRECRKRITEMERVRTQALSNAADDARKALRGMA